MLSSGSGFSKNSFWNSFISSYLVLIEFYSLAGKIKIHRNHLLKILLPDAVGIGARGAQSRERMIQNRDII